MTNDEAPTPANSRAEAIGAEWTMRILGQWRFQQAAPTEEAIRDLEERLRKTEEERDRYKKLYGDWAGDRFT